MFIQKLNCTRHKKQVLSVYMSVGYQWQRSVPCKHLRGLLSFWREVPFSHKNRGRESICFASVEEFIRLLL